MISAMIKSVSRTDFDKVIEDIWVTGNERIIIMTHHATPARVTSDIDAERSLHFVRVGTADVTITTNGRHVAAVTMVSPDTWEVVFVEPDVSNADRIKV